MLRITTSGSGRDLAADVRAVHASLVPYAAATALTRSAFIARDAVRTKMPQVFDRPVSYTLNALRVERATAKNLTAMVAVKDTAATAGRPAQSYLLPEVEGGARNATGLELRLRYTGFMAGDSFIVPGDGAQLDAYGNIRRTQIASVLRALDAGRVKGGKIFFTQMGKRAGKNKNVQGAIWERVSKDKAQPIMFFTKDRPNYRPRFDFHAYAQAAAQEAMPEEFARALSDLIARRGGSR